MFCFPVSVKAPTDGQSQSVVELDLIGEMVDTVVDFARKLAPQKQAPAKRELTDFERLAIAKNPAAPVEWLRALSFDQSSAIRHELVFNPSLPQDALFRLAQDSNRFIASEARALLNRAA